MDKRIGELFQKIEDPRVDRTKKHPLESILYIVLCGTMAGVESWIGYEDYAEAHEEILKEFIDLPHGIPSHDTIARVISALNVEEFSSRFESFTQELIQQVKGTLAIDGKTMRRSFDSKRIGRPSISFRLGPQDVNWFWLKKEPRRSQTRLQLFLNY